MEATRRKILTGTAVLDRILTRLGLIGWLRRVLDAGLTRSCDRALFNLTGDGPLIPQEDWMGWPDAPEETLPEAPPTTLSAGRRRARLAYLTKQRTILRAELDELQTRYEPHRDRRNDRRRILVGAVLLTRAFRRHGVARWLRRLLDRRYTAPRDRALFVLEGVGALVPMEDQAALRLTRRQAATRVSDRPLAADGQTRRQPSAATRASDGGDSVHLDVHELLPGWRPYRIEGSASDSGGRTRSVWGARLTGRAAVSALPKELRGRQIGVTDSNCVSWTTTVTDVVSRDERTVIVRNTGRPRTDGTGSPSRQAPASSSS